MPLEVVRGVWGALLLLAPRPLLERLGSPTRGIVRATRILGARHLVEVALLSRRHRRVPPRWPVLVDIAHAASMLSTAACSRRLRRDALLSAAAATVLASWGELERLRG